MTFPFPRLPHFHRTKTQLNQTVSTVKHSSNAVLQMLQRNLEETENKAQEESLLLLIKNPLQLRKHLPRKRVLEFFKPWYHKPVCSTVINSWFLLQNNLLTSDNTSARQFASVLSMPFPHHTITLLFLSKTSNFWPCKYGPALQETVGN